MKLISIDIAAFGRLKDYHLDTDEGITLIFGHNEEGKTTLMAFIKMMFYGSAGKKQDLAANPRKKYRPWDGSLMAGSVTFEQGGRRYRIEREFGASNSADKITLVDLDMGKTEVIPGTQCLGERFFALSEAAFEKSIFVTDSIPAAKGAGADGELNTRLAGVMETGDEETSYEEVTARLKRAREALLSKSGRVGSLDKARQRIREIEAELAICQKAEEELAALEKQQAETQTALNESSRAGAKLFEDLKGLDKIKKRGFVKQYIESYNALEELTGRLTLKDGNMADEDYAEDGLLLAKEAAELNTRALQARKLYSEAMARAKEAEELPPTPDTAEETRLKEAITRCDGEIEAARQPAEQKKGGALKALLIGLGAALILLAAGAYFIEQPLFILPLALIGAGLAVWGALIKGGDKKAAARLDELLREKQRLLTLAEAENARLARAKQQLAAAELLYRERAKDAEEKGLDAQNAEAAAEEARQTLSAYCRRLREITDPQAAQALFFEVKSDLAAIDAAKRQFALARQRSGCENIEEAEKRLATYDAEGVPDGDFTGSESLSDMVKARSKQTTELRSRLTALQLQIKTAAEEAGRAEVLRREKEELSAAIEKGEEFCRQTDTACTALEEAYRQFRRDYSGRLDLRTGEILAQLTEGRYSGVSVSKNFEVNVTSPEAFGLKETDALSRGAADQVYLALRLAMAELIGGEEDLPLLLDDPLDRYDDGRAEKALSFLKDYGGHRQVILFTCHSYFADMAKALDIKIKDFKENAL